MENKLDYDRVLQSLSTRQEILDLIEAIDTLLSSLYQTKQMSLDDRLGETVSLHAKNTLHKLYELHKLENADQTALKDFFTDVRNQLGKFSTVILTVAVEPDKKILDESLHSLREKMGDNLVFDIVVDQKILGGAQVIWGGNYFDFSLKKEIEEWFESRAKNKNKI